MAVKKGQDVWVASGAVVINGMTDKSLDLAITEIPTTTNDDAGWSTSLTGTEALTFNFTFYDDESDTSGFDELYDQAIAGTAVTVIYGSGVKTTGERVIYGSAVVLSVNKKDTIDSACEVTASMKITGAPTRATSTTTLA